MLTYKDIIQHSKWMIYGPSGTGKTNFAEELAEGFDTDGIPVTAISFTKKAAEELQRSGKMKAKCTTIHALALESCKVTNPDLKLMVGIHKKNVIQDMAENDPIRNIHEIEKEIERHNLERTKTSHYSMYIDYEFAKVKHGVSDFNDIIQQANHPVGEGCLIVDECQDITATTLGKILQWSKTFSYLVLLGDPRQSIFRWSGADPEKMLERLKVEGFKEHLLDRGYRMRENIHEMTQIMPTHHRKLRDEVYRTFRADKSEGYVNHIYADSNSLRKAIFRINKELEDHIEEGRSIQISCRTNSVCSSVASTLEEIGYPYEWSRKTPKNIYEEDEEIQDNGMQGITSLPFRTLLAIENAYRTNNDIASNFEDLADTIFPEWREDVSILELNEVNNFKMDEGYAYLSRLLERYDTLKEASSRKPILVTTFHKAKGTSADAVYVMAKYPKKGRIMSRLENPIIDWPEKKILLEEEEWAGLYVACTRARDYLTYISFPDGDPISTKYGRHNRFTGFPAELKCRIEDQRQLENS